MKLKIGFSPCPNDTFIFEAMINGRIDTGGIEYDWFLADVEELNHKAIEGSADITKISYHAYAYAASHYLLLDSGGALGRGNGPLLISKRKISNEEVNNLRIAIPGKYTTANLLLGIAWPKATNKHEYLFSDIPQAVLSGEADAGLIIHETRFTYQSMGLHKIADLGEFWEKETGAPIPLGAIVINRNIPFDTAVKVNNAIRKSLEFARANPGPSSDFIKVHAQEMEPSVIKEHIKLYVNDFSLSLGEEGKDAVNKLYYVAGEKKIIPPMPGRIFLL